VDPLKGFYPAEGYHQDFIAKNPNNPYVMFNDLPKIRDLKRLYPEYYQELAQR
jgi:peptide-methionine (S)-S-oxide reductase